MPGGLPWHCLKCVKWADTELTANQNVPVTTAYVTMDCKGMGAASVSQGGRALPAKKESRLTYATTLAMKWPTASIVLQIPHLCVSALLDTQGMGPIAQK